MIMLALNTATQPFEPVEMTAAEALTMVGQMVNDDVTVRTTDFRTPDDRHLIIFWSEDGQGRVGTLFEHTMTYVTNMPSTLEVRTMPVR